MNGQREMHPLVFEFLLTRFEQDVHDLMDDPSFLVDEDGHGIKKWIVMYVYTARFLNLNFWDLAHQQGTPFEIKRLREMLHEADLAWGWRPEMDPIEIEPAVADVESTDMKSWCYQFRADTRVHFGPVRAPSVPRLLELLQAEHGKRQIEGVRFWLVDKTSYLYPPRRGDGITVYTFTNEHGWRPITRT